jgi:hypothetical protein
MNKIKVVHKGKHIFLYYVETKEKIFESSNKKEEENFLEACNFVFSLPKNSFEIIGEVAV